MKFENTVSAVSYINEIFGNQFGGNNMSVPEYDAYVGGQLSLCAEELKEYFDADELEDHDQALRMKLDAIGDFITVVDGIPHKAGIEMPADFIHSILNSEDGNDTFGIEYEEIKDYISGYSDNPIFQRSKKTFGKDYIKFTALEMWQSLRIMAAQMAYECGVDAEKVYYEVHHSNLSKTCADLTEMAATLKKYYNDFGLKYSGEIVENGHNSDSDLRIQKVNGLYILKTNRDVMMGQKAVKAGKFLKGVSFVEPDFSDVFVENIPERFARGA